MRTDITSDFEGATEKKLKVFYDDSLGNFDIETQNEVISFYDELNESGDGSNGEAAKKVQNFIDEFNLNNYTIKEIRSLTKLSQVNFAAKYGIPRRTLENWESGTNNPPQYVIDMLERTVENDIGRFEVQELRVFVDDIHEEINPGCTYGCNLPYDPVISTTKFQHIWEAIRYMRSHHYRAEKDFVIEYNLYETDGGDIVGDVIAWSTEDGIQLN